jgi:hypothetical protein
LIKSVFLELEHFRTFGDQQQIATTFHTLVQAGFARVPMNQITDVQTSIAKIKKAVEAFNTQAKCFLNCLITAIETTSRFPLLDSLHSWRLKI